MTGFGDIFKSGFLEGLSSGVSAPTMVIAMILAIAVGFFIFFIYRRSFQGVMYSSSFAITLIALTLISTLIILAVSSNVILSLGMVGALSIVRFRAAIKDPLDLAFLFWSIAAGIVIAAGMFLLAVIGSVIIGAVLLLTVNRKPHDTPYILVVSCADQAVETAVAQALSAKVRRSKIKSKTVTAERIELNYEIRLKSEDTSFVNELSIMNGVKNTVLVSYDGDYMG
ncbi:MAG: DUF4956 domain-containing protein [Clostridiales Family XIII bacterium]|jgi:uncharacterized membrane protein YhiD involved in acid resistance|nr:DUF4956 domain-containing protein [Clostridiales Family XIII bacterium]